jgi:hypothetical protein
MLAAVHTSGFNGLTCLHIHVQYSISHDCQKGNKIGLHLEGGFQFRKAQNSITILLRLSDRDSLDNIHWNKYWKGHPKQERHKLVDKQRFLVQ